MIGGDKTHSLKVLLRVMRLIFSFVVVGLIVGTLFSMVLDRYEDNVLTSFRQHALQVCQQVFGMCQGIHAGKRTMNIPSEVSGIPVQSSDPIPEPQHIGTSQP